MSSFLRLLLLLVIAFTISAADKGNQEIINALNGSVTEQLKGLKETWEEVSSKVKELNDSDEDEEERIIGWGTTPTIIQPTPVTATPTTLSPILVDPVPPPAATPSAPKPKPPGSSASKPGTSKPPAASATVPPPAVVVSPTPSSKPGTSKPPAPSATVAPPAVVVAPTPSATVPPPAVVVTPTPVLVTPQTPTPILVDPPKPVVLPPPAEAIPTGLKPLCGKRGNCYRWFQDEVDLTQEGFSRCDFLNEHWAKKYCCVDTATH